MTANDIESAEDIDRLVKQFYQQVLDDPIIGFFFTDIANIDLDSHLPKISAFWQRQILGQLNYQGRPFEAHLKLHQIAELSSHHFHRWLYLFENSVDDLFTGANANAIKQRANNIANAMETALYDRQAQTLAQNRETRGVQFFQPE